MKGDQHMLESNCMRGGMSCERSCQYDTSEPVCTDTTSQVCEDVPEQVTNTKYFYILQNIFTPGVRDSDGQDLPHSAGGGEPCLYIVSTYLHISTYLLYLNIYSCIYQVCSDPEDPEPQTECEVVMEQQCEDVVEEVCSHVTR